MKTLQTYSVIEDGYTKKSYIKSMEGIHDGLLFEYRPMLATDAEDLETAMVKFEGSKAVRAIAKAVADHLVSWSEYEKNGQLRKITFENACRLPREILREIRHILQGSYAGDPIPDATLEEESEYQKALHAAAEGKAPGLEQLEADRKN